MDKGDALLAFYPGKGVGFSGTVTTQEELQLVISALQAAGPLIFKSATEAHTAEQSPERSTEPESEETPATEAL